jgi:hypothetical protein
MERARADQPSGINARPHVRSRPSSQTTAAETSILPACGLVVSRSRSVTPDGALRAGRPRPLATNQPKRAPADELEQTF